MNHRLVIPPVWFPWRNGRTATNRLMQERVAVGELIQWQVLQVPQYDPPLIIGQLSEGRVSRGLWNRILGSDILS